MSKNWNPLDRVAGWLRTRQPRSGTDAISSGGDADLRRARADLDAVRARFPDHA